MHFSVFRYRLNKNAFAGPKRFLHGLSRNGPLGKNSISSFRIISEIIPTVRSNPNITVFKKISNSVLETNLADLTFVLFPIYTESYHVTRAFPTLPIFLTIHDTSNVRPEKAFGGTRTFSTLKSGKARVWNPQMGLGINAPELSTYSILHSIRVSAG